MPFGLFSDENGHTLRMTPSHRAVSRLPYEKREEFKNRHHILPDMLEVSEHALCAYTQCLLCSRHARISWRGEASGDAFKVDCDGLLG